MIPNERLSSETFESSFRELTRLPDQLLEDFEYGGVGLNNASQGLWIKQWYARVHEFVNVQVRASDTDWTTVFTRAIPVTEVALAFDTNMRLVIAFVEDNQPKFWWFDPTVNQTVFVTLPTNTRSPRCCLDEKRRELANTADTIIAYIKDDELCFRALRDRFEIEYVLLDGINPVTTLVDVNMNRLLRLQFQLSV